MGESYCTHTAYSVYEIMSEVKRIGIVTSGGDCGVTSESTLVKTVRRLEIYLGDE